MKVIKIKNHLTVVLADGSVLTNDSCTDDLYNEVMKNKEDEQKVITLLAPELSKRKEEVEIKTKLLDGFQDSKYLTVFANSVYLKSISELTVPEDLAVAFYKAEQANDKQLMDTYLNFWTLASLNPDSRARTNLFWFLKKYGMTISKSGLFVAYRNVELKSEGKGIKTDLASFVSDQYTRIKTKLKKSPKNYFVGESKTDDGTQLVVYTDTAKFNGKALGNVADLYLKLSDLEEAPIYTDSYSRTFTIQIGTPVTMDRNQCNPNQNETCSKGLHVAGREWLTKGYFGKTSLMVLVNPTDVVAVPPDDNYGKMRVCAYYPVQLIERDKDGNITNQEINDGFEDDFMHTIAYEGQVNNEDTGNYSINIPDIPEINKARITSRLKEISKQLNKYIN